MILRDEILEKIRVKENNISLNNILFLYYFRKTLILKADNYNDYLIYFSLTYIAVFSILYNEEAMDLGINKILSFELNENIDNILNKIRKENKSWELGDEEINNKIDYILNNNKKD